MRGLPGCPTLCHGGTLRPLASLCRVRTAAVRTQGQACHNQGTSLPTLPGRSVCNCVRNILLSGYELIKRHML